MNKPKDRWTKGELTLRQGPAELAKAVIKQWIDDGKPECDAEVIQQWVAVLREAKKLKSPSTIIDNNVTIHIKEDKRFLL